VTWARSDVGSEGLEPPRRKRRHGRCRRHFHTGTAPRQRYQGLIRRNLHATQRPTQTVAGLRSLAQHLASFVAVERPRKAKIRPTSSPASLSVWELDCHASLTTAPQVGWHLRLSVDTRQVPLLTLPSGMQRAQWKRGDKRSQPLPIEGILKLLMLFAFRDRAPGAVTCSLGCRVRQEAGLAAVTERYVPRITLREGTVRTVTSIEVWPVRSTDGC
jgi:hypothetical protein